jgi:hypothetical protein
MSEMIRVIMPDFEMREDDSPMDEKPKRKRAPITLVERVNMIAAFVICLVVIFISFHLLLATGLFCILLPGIVGFFLLFGMTGVVASEAEAEKAKQDEAYTARPLVDEDDPIVDEKPKHDMKR